MSAVEGGGGALSLFARLPLIKPYYCEGYLCSHFQKILYNIYCNMKALQLYSNWSGNIASHFVLKDCKHVA